jgi:site-specific recombinase XerD
MRNAIAPNPPSFAALVQQFFTEHLVTQRAVSPRTVACYRDALMLFLDFASHKLGTGVIVSFQQIDTVASGDAA